MKHDSRITSLKQRIGALRSRFSSSSIRYGKSIKHEAVELVHQYGLPEISKALDIQRSLLQGWVRKIGGHALDDSTSPSVSDASSHAPMGFVELTEGMGNSSEDSTLDSVHVTCSRLGLEMSVSIQQLAQLLRMCRGEASC